MASPSAKDLPVTNDGEGAVKQKRKRKPSKPKFSPEVVRNRREEILKRFKIKPEVLALAPPITPILKSTVKGGLKATLEAMRFASDDPEIRSFLKKYDSLAPSDLEFITWETICLAANVNPKHLLGSIQLAVSSHCATRSRFIAVSNHPNTMKARVKYALLPSGEKDRTAHDIVVGAQASAKGPTFIGKAIFGAGHSDEEDGKEQVNPTTVKALTDGDDFDAIFPPVTDMQDKLTPIRQRLIEK